MRDCDKLDLGSNAIHDQTLQLYHRPLHKKNNNKKKNSALPMSTVVRWQFCVASNYVLSVALKYISAFYDLRLDDRAFGKFKIAFSIRCKLLDSSEFCFLYLELHCIFWKWKFCPLWIPCFLYELKETLPQSTVFTLMRAITAFRRNFKFKTPFPAKNAMHVLCMTNNWARVWAEVSSDMVA